MWIFSTTTYCNLRKIYIGPCYFWWNTLQKFSTGMPTQIMSKFHNWCKLKLRVSTLVDELHYNFWCHINFFRKLCKTFTPLMISLSWIYSFTSPTVFWPCSLLSVSLLPYHAKLFVLGLHRSVVQCCNNVAQWLPTTMSRKQDIKIMR